ncbi:MAG: sugar-binding transcriptional regulator [Christensenellales bacterium]|jgi:deoxyribonucleoside regulator
MSTSNLLVKLSRMYYEENLSQKEISEVLGISRAQISRLLQKARNENIVTIRINDPNLNESLLENELIQRYGLKDAVVVNTAGSMKEAVLDEFGKLAAVRLVRYIKDQDIVGIMSGRTIASLVQGIVNFPHKNLKIVPLVGGLGSRNSTWHANSIAEEFANKTHSVSYTLNAPSVMQSQLARDMLVSEPGIQSLLKVGTVSDVAIVGIGQAEIGASNVLAGGLTEQDIFELKDIGAIGSMCTSYFDRDGNLLYPEIEKRMIGQPLENLRGAKTIAVAIGKSKQAAIDAALKTGHVDVFMTNVETAQHILSF